MWTTSYEQRTSASAERVWDALRALHSGTPLGPLSDSFVLHGPFEVGTSITVTPQGQDSMTSTIVELVPGTTYADLTEFGKLRLTFRHTLQDLPDGGAAVRHTLEIDGPGADKIGPELGPQISGDFPAAMAELLDAAERGVRV